MRLIAGSSHIQGKSCQFWTLLSSIDVFHTWKSAKKLALLFGLCQLELLLSVVVENGAKPMQMLVLNEVGFVPISFR